MTKSDEAQNKIITAFIAIFAAGILVSLLVYFFGGRIWNLVYQRENGTDNFTAILVVFAIIITVAALIIFIFRHSNQKPLSERVKPISQSNSIRSASDPNISLSFDQFAVKNSFQKSLTRTPKEINLRVNSLGKCMECLKLQQASNARQISRHIMKTAPGADAHVVVITAMPGIGMSSTIDWALEHVTNNRLCFKLKAETASDRMLLVNKKHLLPGLIISKGKDKKDQYIKLIGGASMKTPAHSFSFEVNSCEFQIQRNGIYLTKGIENANNVRIGDFIVQASEAYCQRFGVLPLIFVDDFRRPSDCGFLKQLISNRNAVLILGWYRPFYNLWRQYGNKSIGLGREISKAIGRTTFIKRDIALGDKLLGLLIKNPSRHMVEFEYEFNVFKNYLKLSALGQPKEIESIVQDYIKDGRLIINSDKWQAIQKEVKMLEKLTTIPEELSLEEATVDIKDIRDGVGWAIFRVGNWIIREDRHGFRRTIHLDDVHKSIADDLAHPQSSVDQENDSTSDEKTKADAPLIDEVVRLMVERFEPELKWVKFTSDKRKKAKPRRK